MVIFEREEETQGWGGGEGGGKGIGCRYVRGLEGVREDRREAARWR